MRDAEFDASSEKLMDVLSVLQEERLSRTRRIQLYRLLLYENLTREFFIFPARTREFYHRLELKIEQI